LTITDLLRRLLLLDTAKDPQLTTQKPPPTDPSLGGMTGLTFLGDLFIDLSIAVIVATVTEFRDG